MPTISIVRAHSLSHKAAKDAARHVVEDLRKRFALDYAWDGDDVTFDRPGVSGRMHVGRDELTLDVKLGLLLGALKSTVEREINAQLDTLFAAPAKAPVRKVKPAAGAGSASGPAVKPAASSTAARAPASRPAATPRPTGARKPTSRSKG